MSKVSKIKRVHKCSVCGKYGHWGKGWMWYGSYKDLDDGKEVEKTCSDKCRGLELRGESE